MAWTKIASINREQGDGTGEITSNGGTTGGINTTGADIIFIHIADWMGGTPGGAPSDSKGNIYDLIAEATSSNSKSRLYRAKNAASGTGHTFTFSSTGTYPGIQVIAFSGSNTTSPNDQSSTNTVSSGTTIQPGSITPTENGVMLISSLYSDSGNHSESINLSFTLELAGSVGGRATGFAFFEQATAAAINPTWTHGSSADAAATIASFKAAGGGGATFHGLLLLGCGA